MDHQVNKKITISGTVQGVGYRYWLKELCDTNNVNGWVLNKKNETPNNFLQNKLSFNDIEQIKLPFYFRKVGRCSLSHQHPFGNTFSYILDIQNFQMACL